MHFHRFLPSIAVFVLFVLYVIVLVWGRVICISLDFSFTPGEVVLAVCIAWIKELFCRSVGIAAALIMNPVLQSENGRVKYVHLFLVK